MLWMRKRTPEHPPEPHQGVAGYVLVDEVTHGTVTAIVLAQGTMTVRAWCTGPVPARNGPVQVVVYGTDMTEVMHLRAEVTNPQVAPGQPMVFDLSVKAEDKQPGW